MSDEKALRGQAREAIRAGTLPRRRPERMWGGPGGGAPCALCRKPVGSDEIEFELQFTSGEGAGAANYHVHLRCLAAWELERHSGGSNGCPLPVESNTGIIAGSDRNAKNDGERR